MGIEEFIKTYYIDPIYNGTGYNVYNTLTYAVLFILIAFLVFKLIKKMNITVDRKFFLSLIPFMVLGGLLRALEDASAFKNPLFISPLIYITIFFIALISLVLSKLTEKYFEIKYYKVFALIGLIFTAYSATLIKITNFTGLYLIIGIALIWIAVIFGARIISMKKFEKLRPFFSIDNSTVLSAHMFDATTTFVSIEYFPYFEQHVLPSFLISIFGPAVMFALKLIVVSIVLYYIDKEQNNEQKMFIKIAILILGLGPGVRNFVRLIIGV